MRAGIRVVLTSALGAGCAASGRGAAPAPAVGVPEPATDRESAARILMQGIEKANTACDELRSAQEHGLPSPDAERWLPHCAPPEGPSPFGGDPTGALIDARQRLLVACEDFSHAFALYPKSAALYLWLAMCEDQQNRPGHAAVLLRRALELNGAETGDPDLDRRERAEAREQLATDSLVRVLPRVSWLAVEVTVPPRGSRVAVDGNVLPPAYGGRYYPLDPGRRKVVVDAAGYSAKEDEVELAAGVGVRIPVELEPKHPHRWAGLAIGAGGLTAAAVATFFAARMYALIAESNAHCQPASPKDVCTPEGAHLRDRAEVQQALAIGFAIPAAIGVGTGLYLYW